MDQKLIILSISTNMFKFGRAKILRENFFITRDIFVNFYLFNYKVIILI